MPLLGLSRNSAVPGNFFRENLSATYSAALLPCVEQSSTQKREIQRFAN